MSGSARTAVSEKKNLWEQLVGPFKVPGSTFGSKGNWTSSRRSNRFSRSNHSMRALRYLGSVENLDGVAGAVLGVQRHGSDGPTVHGIKGGKKHDRRKIH